VDGGVVTLHRAVLVAEVGEDAAVEEVGCRQRRVEPEGVLDDLVGEFVLVHAVVGGGAEADRLDVPGAQSKRLIEVGECRLVIVVLEVGLAAADEQVRVVGAELQRLGERRDGVAVAVQGEEGSAAAGPGIGGGGFGGDDLVEGVQCCRMVLAREQILGAGEQVAHDYLPVGIRGL
jgi:hypothetical protein